MRRRLTTAELVEMRRIAFAAKRRNRQPEEVPAGWESHRAGDILALVEEVEAWRAGTEAPR